MEPVNEMKEMMQARMAMSSLNQTIKVKLFSGKQEDFPKWLIKQKQNFIIADMGHILEETFLAKLPRSKTAELDESKPDHKQWAKYRQPNTKAGAVILSAQENEDVILALQEANELKLTWPSGIVSTMWQTLIDIFQPDDGLSRMQIKEELYALKFTKKEEPQKLVLKIMKISMRYKKS